MRVVVVDDDPAIAEFHALIVSQTPGFRMIGKAHNGLSALRFLTENDTDLVLLDMFLPDLTGVQLLQKLRAIGRFFDVIMLTAADDVATVRAARALGVSEYLVKPFTPQELSRRMLLRAQAHLDASRDGTVVAQARIDETLRAGATQASGELPKGLAATTLSKIHDFAREADGGFTAQEVSNALGMSRVSARRYLEYLAEHHYLVIEPRYGSSGRPVLEYSAI